MRGMSVSDEEKSQIKALLGRDPSQTESIIFDHLSYLWIESSRVTQYPLPPTIVT